MDEGAAFEVLRDRTVITGIYDNAILEISTVVGCRMACKHYCPQATHASAYRATGGARVMSFDDFRKCIDNVPPQVSICFAGMAEPWLNPECTKMIMWAHYKGHELSVFTTGYGVSLDDIQQVMPIRFRHFCLHLPDADGAMNLQPDKKYLDVIRAIRTLIPSSTAMVIGRLHQDLIPIVGNLPDGTNSLFSRAGNLDHLAIPKKTGKLRCSSCGPAINHNVLLPNGDVALCCMTYDLKHILGNLLTMEYEDLFQGDEYKKIQRGLDGDESIDIACRQCEVSEAC